MHKHNGIPVWRRLRAWSWVLGPYSQWHMPQLAQLADFMHFQAYGAAPVAVHA